MLFLVGEDYGLIRSDPVLQKEVAPLGIHVTIVEPGAFRTDFLEPTSIRTSTHRIAAYQETSGANLDRLGGLAGKQMGDPVKGVRAIIEAVEAPHPPLHPQVFGNS